MHSIVRCVVTAVVLFLAASAPAAFVNDEFDGASLGSQWTVVQSNPAGSTVTLTGSHLRLEALPGTDDWFHVNNGVSVEQDAPDGTNWEVVTKIDNYDPTEPGFRRRFLKSGIQVWQDVDHWVTISILSNIDGTTVTLQAYWQADAVPPNDALTDDAVDKVEELQFTPGGPFYLKVVKSTKGYLAQYSLNGTSWVNSLPPIRNLDASDGYFTNEKIRIFQAGGPPDPDAGVVKPADFDYARASAIPAPPSGYSDDEFDGPTLGPKWQFHEGFLPGSYTLEGGFLKLTPGNGNDIWDAADRAVHMYQDAPVANDLILTVKGEPLDLRSYEQWNAWGMMLWQDQSNWVMITNQKSEGTPANRVEVAFKRAGQFNGMNTAFGDNPCPPYLRIEQSGYVYTTSYSYDNVTYTVPAGWQITYPARLRLPQVHLINKRVFYADAPEHGTGLVAQFDWLHATYSTAAEDWQLFE